MSSLLFVLLLAAGEPVAKTDIQGDAQAFLDLYNSLYVGQSTIAGEAEWAASTDVTDVNEAKRTAAGQVYATFRGDKEILSQAKAFLERKSELQPMQVRQLHSILLRGAGYPGTIPDVVKARVEAESRQAATQDGYTFCLQVVKEGEKCATPLSANEIDEKLRTSTKVDERLAYWNASKEIGRPLKAGLGDLQKLRNQVAREMGYSSFFALQVADYGMTTDEMLALNDKMLADMGPFYAELHTYAGRQFAKRYGQPAPKGGKIPAHWFPNRWAQNWPGIVEGVDLDPYFKDKSAEWIVKQAESFFTSIGFQALPPSFWEKSDLYPVAKGSERKKNSHASAWHVDLGKDVRSLMSVEPNPRWFETTHHELGHIYYYLAYSRPEVPPTLREGANRAFHEAVGDLLSIAAGQTPYLKQQKIVPAKTKFNETQLMLNAALEKDVVFMPWSAGVMTRFEYELYEKNLPADQWQKRWWELVDKYQKVSVPDARRLEDMGLCDACSKTHINDDPAQYYDYALANVIKFQLHEHIATKILKQDPRNCNYYGNKQIGDFLWKILEQGATRDWREVMREATGEEISTRALLQYYDPLRKWLEKENRKAGG